MSKYPFFIHSLLLTHYFKALREARGFRPNSLVRQQGMYKENLKVVNSDRLKTG